MATKKKGPQGATRAPTKRKVSVTLSPETAAILDALVHHLDVPQSSVIIMALRRMGTQYKVTENGDG